MVSIDFMIWVLGASIIWILLTIALTSAIRHYAIRKGVQDVPNARSSHRMPTPRGGGLSIVVMMMIGTAIGCAKTWLSLPAAMAMLVGGVLIAGIGWIDDHRSISAKLRLLVHAAVSVGVTLSVLGPDYKILLGPLGSLTSIFAVVFSIFSIIWMINLYNFMDGIDGIAAGEGASVGLSALVLLMGQSLASSSLGVFYGMLLLSCIGFLFMNWQPAKIFMGDVSSGFLGFCFGFLALWGERTGELPWVTSMILLGSFVVDATYTLVQRALLGQKLFQAHRSHAYQNAVQAGKSHAWVSSIMILINLAWLLPVAWLSLNWPEYGITFLVLAYLPLLGIAWKFKAGKALSPSQV